MSPATISNSNMKILMSRLKFKPKLIPLRRAAALFLLLGCLDASAGPATNARTVVLQWNYPAAEISTNREFLVFTAPAITIPHTNWTFVTNLSATNYTAIVDTNAQFSVRVPVGYGPQYWTIAVWDPFWGTNFFDVSAGTNALPRTDNPISIAR